LLSFQLYDHFAIPPKRAPEHPGIRVNEAHHLEKVRVKKIDRRFEINGIRLLEQSAPQIFVNNAPTGIVAFVGQVSLLGMKEAPIIQDQLLRWKRQDTSEADGVKRAERVMYCCVAV